MLEDATYREWTKVFAPNSQFQGNWDEGSEIRFVDDSGSGMLSRIVANRPNEFVSIEHLGEIVDGKENESPAWKGALENYTYDESNGGTLLTVELTGAEMPADMEEMFSEMWPKALNRLKELCEKT